MASGSFLKGDTKMLTEQRYQIILDLLKEKKSVTATEFKEILDTSESTVRREALSLLMNRQLSRRANSMWKRKGKSRNMRQN